MFFSEIPDNGKLVLACTDQPIGCTTNIQLHLCTYFCTNTQTHSLIFCLLNATHNWSLPIFQSALVINIAQHNNSAYKATSVSLKANFSCQWWRVCRRKESNERRVSQKERQDGVEPYIITSTILSPLFSSHFFFSLPLGFGTNRFIWHIEHCTQSTGWLLKVVYREWPRRSFTTIDYNAIHQRSSKPLRGSARYKP